MGEYVLREDAEIGISEPSVRARIEETWGMRAMDANFGMADILSIMGSEPFLQTLVPLQEVLAVTKKTIQAHYTW